MSTKPSFRGTSTYIADDQIMAVVDAAIALKTAASRQRRAGYRQDVAGTCNRRSTWHANVYMAREVHHESGGWPLRLRCCAALK